MPNFFRKELSCNDKKINSILSYLTIFYSEKGDDRCLLPACVKKRTTYALFFYTL